MCVLTRPPLCSQLRKMGIKIWIASGDNARAVAHVARQLGGESNSARYRFRYLDVSIFDQYNSLVGWELSQLRFITRSSFSHFQTNWFIKARPPV